MARIILTVLAAVLIAGVAAAQECSTPRSAGGAGQSPPAAGNSHGSTGNSDESSSHRAFGDPNSNPSAAVDRGDIDENSVQSLLQS